MLTINKNSKARSVIMAAAAVLAIGGAMAKNIPFKYGKAVTYYAIRTGSVNQYTWGTLSETAGKSCTPEETTAACSVVSNDGTRPADNSHPNTANFTYSDDGSLYE